MTSVTERNFGLLIAYLLPGFGLLWVFRSRSVVIDAWLAGSPDGPTVGGFLYATLASIAAGMLLSAVRWLVLDSIHHATGIRTPAWDFSLLPETLSAFAGAVENHFRYYEFFGHSLIVVLASLFQPEFHDASPLLAMLVPLLFAASRDALRKYYERTARIVGETLPGDANHDQRLETRGRRGPGASRGGR